MIIRKIKEVIKSKNPYYNYKPKTIRSINFTITDAELVEFGNNKVKLPYWDEDSYVIHSASVAGNSRIDAFEYRIEGTSNGSKFEEVYRQTLDNGVKGIVFEVIDTPTFSFFGYEREYNYRTIYEDLPEWIECNTCGAIFNSEYLEDEYCPLCENKIYEYEL